MHDVEGKHRRRTASKKLKRTEKAGKNARYLEEMKTIYRRQYKKSENVKN